MSLRANQLLRRGGSPPSLMGIINATPDSFSDGGLWNSPAKALEHASDLVCQGADILDVGGESTRPGADPVPCDLELMRVIPVLDLITASVSVPVSIDTMKAVVARKAVEHGASIINDVSGFSDPEMARTAAELDVPVVVMNCYGGPKTFDTAFIQGDIVETVCRNLCEKVEEALDAGVREDNIIIDPGVGFGTTSEQSRCILGNSPVFGFGKYPVLIGPSRKRFLKDCYPGMEQDDATVEACILAKKSGADILRVHDVGRVAEKFRSGGL